MSSKEETISRSSRYYSSAKAKQTIKNAICIFLILTTLIVYSQIKDHKFLNYDDNEYVTENLNVKAEFTRESVIWAFTTSHNANWFPITWLSHMLDYQLYDSNPKGHHLTNLFFHIASTLILFIVLLRMTGAIWQSGFVATLFALHPFNVESVAWVAERKNVLSTFFWLLTMWAYIHYVDKPNVKRYGLIALFFTLGLLSKPMLITLPFVLLMMDYWPLNRLAFGKDKVHNEITGGCRDTKFNIWFLVREKIPLFLLAAGSGIATFVDQKSGGALQAMEIYSLSARLTNAMVSYMEYLIKTMWPEGLAVFYSHPGNTLATWKGLLCGIVLVAISAVSVRFIRRSPYFAFGWFWYLGTLVPVIQIVQTGGHRMADRYAYVPLIGIFITIAWGLPELMAKWRHREKILIILAGIFIPTLMAVTWNQVSHWKNSITIFKHAINVTDKVYPDFALPHNNMGLALHDEQRTGEAISHYKIAIKLNPDYAPAHYNLGIALSFERKTEEAISHYKSAIKFKPDFVDAHINLGNSLLAGSKTDEAISHYKMAIKLKSSSVDAHYNLGNALLNIGKTGEAISHYKMSIKFKSDFAAAHNNLGSALLAEQKTEEAVSHYRKALKLKPGFIDARHNLNIALRRTGSQP